jgi:hypothetical protein
LIGVGEFADAELSSRRSDENTDAINQMAEILCAEGAGVKYISGWFNFQN